MWLIVTSFAAIIATIIWYASENARKTYKVGFLSLVFWGTVLMVFVDHTMAYLEEGEFFDLSGDAVALSAVLLITALIVWEIVLLLKDPKGLLKGLKM